MRRLTALAAMLLTVLLLASCGLTGGPSPLDGQSDDGVENGSGLAELDDLITGNDPAENEQTEASGDEANGTPRRFPLNPDHIPPDWPDDFPLPDDILIEQAHQREAAAGDGREMRVLFKVGGRPIDVFYLYREFLLDDGWNPITWPKQSDDPYPYATGLDILAEKGDWTADIRLAEAGKGPRRQGITGVEIYLTQGDLSPFDENSWTYYEEGYTDRDLLPVNFDQKRWLDEKVEGYDHLPPGWPRQFFYSLYELNSYYPDRPWTTEPSSYVQTTGQDDGSQRLILQMEIAGEPNGPYQVNDYRIGRSDYELVHQDKYPTPEDPLPSEDNPLTMLAVRQGKEALYVEIWYDEDALRTTERITFDEHYVPEFYQAQR